MNRKKKIHNLLLNKFSKFSIEIIDNSDQHIGHHNFNGKDETHLLIILKSKLDQKINRLSIHREINKLVKNEFQSGLHSLEIKIK